MSIVHLPLATTGGGRSFASPWRRTFWRHSNERCRPLTVLREVSRGRRAGPTPRLSPASRGTNARVANAKRIVLPHWEDTRPTSGLEHVWTRSEPAIAQPPEAFLMSTEPGSRTSWRLDRRARRRSRSRASRNANCLSTSSSAETEESRMSMARSTFWWATDCRQCGSRRLLEARKPEETRFRPRDTVGCITCRARLGLGGVDVYLYDRANGTRVAQS